ncbi:MAG: T9SS type A sorting domain-containing protein [Ignavibacteriales bacterium]
MKKYLAYFLVVFSLFSICQPTTFGQSVASKFLRRVYHFNDGKDSIQYRLFVPKFSGDSIKYPLILALHGGGGIGSDNSRQLTGERTAVTWAEDSAQKKNPAFVFAPQINRFPPWLRPYCIDTFFFRINEVIDSMIASYPIDTARIYITGYSLGAVETWALIYLFSRDRFAAAIPMSGLWDFDFPPDPTKIPVWNFHGEVDEQVPIAKSMELMKAIENKGIKVAYVHSLLLKVGLTNSKLDSLWAAGINHIFTIFDNAAHNIPNYTYDVPLLHRWLFAQKKGTFPGKINPCQTEIPNPNTLYDCYPNPFNPTTNIEFKVSNSGLVSLKIFDLLGREIATLLNEEKPAGDYKIQFNGRNLSSGVYFYQLKAGGFTSTKQFVLMK